MTGHPTRLPALLYLSATLGICPTSACTSKTDTSFRLDAGDEAKPELILRKHLLGTGDEDRRIARLAYEDGLNLRRRQVASELRWGPVFKAFCVSAQMHPTSSALVACGDAAIQSAKHSDHAKSNAQYSGVFAHVGMVLTSALVLDELDRGLTPEQRSQAETDRACIVEYLRNPESTKGRCGAVAVLLPELE